MAKKWTDEEIQFLKFAYPNKEFTPKEIAKVLNRSVGTVRGKAGLLGLKIYKENIPEGYKKCSNCNNILPLTFFTKRGDRKHSYRSWCRECRKNEMKEYRKIELVPTELVPTELVPTTKQCKDCNENKPISEFYRNKNNKDKHDNFCKVCSKIRKEKSVLKMIKKRGW